MTERRLVDGLEQPRPENPMYFNCRSYDLVGKLTIDGLRILRGLCASVLNHHLSFPRMTHPRNARDREPVSDYAGR